MSRARPPGVSILVLYPCAFVFPADFFVGALTHDHFIVKKPLECEIQADSVC